MTQTQENQANTTAEEPVSAFEVGADGPSREKPAAEWHKEPYVEQDPVQPLDLAALRRQVEEAAARDAQGPHQQQ